MRIAGSFVALLTLVPFGAIAQVADFQHPPPPEGMSFEPIEPNPYFVQDDKDPRFLHPAPGAERVIDRGYIERMVRGDLPSRTLDLLEALPNNSGPVVLPEPPDPLNLPNLATVVNGNVIIVEGSEQLVPNTEDGRMFNHQGSGLQVVINQVWSRLGDQFDFITVMTTFDDPGAAGYYMPLRQDVTGLGECNFNTGETFGCVFEQVPGSQLQGFVFMNSIDYWRMWDYRMDGYVHDLTDPEANVYAVMGQEIGHRWGAGLRFVDPRSGAVSKQLLGRDSSHWAAWVDSEASVHDGWDWTADDDGNFTVVDDMRRFSTLDLYAMGAKPVGQARPFFFIDGARFIANGYVGNQAVPATAAASLWSVEYMAENNLVFRATGEKVDLTVQDVVDAEGNRCPDPDHTQKTFKQAIVLVTQPNQSASQVQSYVDELEVMMATWEDWWKEKTGKALTLCTDVASECQHAQARLTAHAIINDGKPYVEPGDDFELVVDANAVSASDGAGDTVRNARVTIQYLGNGAEQTYLNLDSNVIELGDLTPGEPKEIALPMSIDSEYQCGYSMIVQMTLESDNAETVVGEYRVFPGYDEIFLATFNQDDNDFEVNVDGYDENTQGEMVWQELALSCTMNPRTPEGDASAGGDGAWTTGPDGLELNGVSSLWSPKIDLQGALDPEVRFMYWLDGAPGAGKLTVRLSTGDTFREAKVYDEPYHGWVLGRVVVNEVFPDKLPEDIYVLFEFEGDGDVEGAIDEVRVLDRQGFCAAQFSGCACSAPGDGEGSEPTGALALVGLAALLLPRRRRKS
jgi:MYXO-CTERM domain-containing protein